MKTMEAMHIAAAEITRMRTSASDPPRSIKPKIENLLFTASNMTPASFAIAAPTDPLSPPLIWAANCSNHVQNPDAEVL